MNILEIIRRKRDKLELKADEIKYFVEEYTKGNIADYQASALIMAIFLNGINRRETNCLALSMAKSGTILDFSYLKKPVVDKHSTGGVGDGTSLVIAPLAASLGVIVPMMSGRALGHTGGTLDKLESIPGFDVNLNKGRYKKQLEKIGVAMTGQTSTIAPCDKKLYALRDVTETVDSIGLISASIMSKKIAEGANGLVLDVKVGTGAFMKNIKDATLLAMTMVDIGKSCGKKITALITDMNQPLGYCIGNSLEIEQALDILNNKGPKDITGLILELCAEMLLLSGNFKDKSYAVKKLKNSLSSGLAMKKFEEIVRMQKGDVRVISNPKKILGTAKRRVDIKSPDSGYLYGADAFEIGICANSLGAGRIRKDDKIDHLAGIVMHKKAGDKIFNKDVVATFYYNRSLDINGIKRRFLKALKVRKSGPKAGNLIIKRIG